MISSHGIFDTLRIRKFSEEQQRKMREFINAHRINSNAPGYDVQNVMLPLNIRLGKTKND